MVGADLPLDHVVRDDCAGEADEERALAAQVAAACESRSPLMIVGGGSKAFLGRKSSGQRLELTGHRGIVEYEPTELVLTARAGTRLEQIEEALAEHDQMLAFEPPHFGPTATLGGTVASGLSGPRRPYAGAVRDFVLGIKLINGRGEVLQFGGRVMKNVAGYDLSRLMAGAMGTLGVLLEISLKVLPRARESRTLRFEMPAANAVQQMNEWAGQPLPLSGACHHQRTLWLRLSGTPSGVRAAAERLGGEPGDDCPPWTDLCEQRLAFFADRAPLWRISLPPACPPLSLSGETLIDWGGGLRWLKSDAPLSEVRACAERCGGHATLFRHGDRAAPRFHPLSQPVASLHARLKRAFDPAGILNPGRMYEAW